jgi:hypothetical protein
MLIFVRSDVFSSDTVFALACPITAEILFPDGHTETVGGGSYIA